MSYEYEFSIPGTLPSLNEYIDACRANMYAANEMKQRAEGRIIEVVSEGPTFTGPVEVEFRYFRPDKRTDKDNVAFAKKFVLDALQKAGVIDSDGWSHCTPYDREFGIDKDNPRTVVLVREEAHV